MMMNHKCPKTILSQKANTYLKHDLQKQRSSSQESIEQFREETITEYRKDQNIESEFARRIQMGFEKLVLLELAHTNTLRVNVSFANMQLQNSIGFSDFVKLHVTTLQIANAANGVTQEFEVLHKARQLARSFFRRTRLDKSFERMILKIIVSSKKI